MELVHRSLLTIDGNSSLPSLASELRKSAFVKVRGDDSKSTLHIYCANASGENVNARRLIWE